MSTFVPLKLVGKKKSSMERRRSLRDSLWRDAEKVIWSRKTDDGYCSVPRTLPLIMTLINQLSPKGKGDASRVYQELWCHDFDLGFIEITDENAHAYASGYLTPTRAVRTWRERMGVLEDLGFIRTKPDGNRKYGYVLLLHPHDVVESLKKKRTISEAWYGAYVKRVEGTGARHGRVSSKTK